jgi:hypothetical protein
MDSSFRHLKRLEEGVKVSIPTDENGLTGRECPNPDCLGNFNVKFGTGLKGDDLPCHCPYCGHIAPHDNFWTQEQLAYIRSIAMNEVSKALKELTADWDRSLRQSTKNSFIKMSVDYKSDFHPIRYYQEKQIETFVTCDICTLEYAIYGVFAFCPDCGTHNSLQILTKNLELVEKEIAFAKTLDDKELADRLVNDALENTVSSFDGFGRATCTAFAAKSNDEGQAQEITFQNISGAQTKVKKLFGFDLGNGIDQQDWDFVIRCFQKRHLLAHKMGVIDEEYVKKARDPLAVVGRKIVITSDEVLQLAQLLRTIGNNLFNNLKS